MRNVLLAGAVIGAAIIALMPTCAHAGGDESTWGPVPMHQSYVVRRDRQQLVQAPLPEAVIPVAATMPTVFYDDPIAPLPPTKGLCDDVRQLFAGHPEFYVQRCRVIDVLNMVEPSRRNSSSPQ